MMKRRLDAAKLRRPAKRSRIADSVNGSWILYVRFFIVWLLVISMDFALEFRFEFLWPFWLLVRSIFDSFRYQGLGLTLIFLTVTLLCDVVCFMFLPVHWLFFVASTYVWVQFVITTERGPCIATISLWLLFVYVEASVRLREIKSMPFHLDICRPFAAHCIGYPVVSLGYGFKNYVGYKMKNYRKVEVCKQNDFYQHLVAYALPIDLQNTLYENLSDSKKESNAKTDVENIPNEPRKRGNKSTDIELKGNSSLSLNDFDTISSISNKEGSLRRNNSNYFEPLDVGFTKPMKNSLHVRSNGDVHNINKRSSKSKPKPPESDYELDISDDESSSGVSQTSHDDSPKSSRNNKTENLQAKLKEEQNMRRKSEQQVSQLENEMKKMRNEVNSVREAELDFRTQINANLIAERYLKSQLDQLKKENDGLEQKISSFTSSKSQDKSLITSLERKLKAERESNANLEVQLKESRKKSINEALSTPRVENHDHCNAKTSELEAEINKLQEKLEEYNQAISELRKENIEMKQKSTENDTDKLKKDIEFLSGALKNLQGKNLHLENSLSSETRLKLDLFSALGDTRRQLEIVQGQLKTKCSEVDLLKGRIAEVMAVMPSAYNSTVPFTTTESSFLVQKDSGVAVAKTNYSPPVSPQNGVA